jgi:hypothetical protein
MSVIGVGVIEGKERCMAA